MAAELVGGAFLSSFLGAVFERLSSPEVVYWIRGKTVGPSLLQRLETSLYGVQAVLNDAEQKQITEPAVKKWLADLKDALYVADDLLDEVSTKAATQKGSGNSLSQSETELVTKIECIIDRLQSTVTFKDKLCLKDFAEDNMSSWRVPSTSLVDEKSCIYGRDEDKKAIIKLLLDDTSDTKISVIPIVGMGGVGKTTLAQLVYNDDEVTGKFDFRAWVCVAEKLDVINVTKIILQAITSSSCNINDFDLLQTNLKEKLAGKTFLIVLDDVWSDQRDMWKNLLKPFQYGNTGSKILVTTRCEKVAFVNPINKPYRLGILSDDDCWSMFLDHSFLSSGSRECATLEGIKRRIVEKCKGLPLVVETLRGLLRTKCDLEDWNDILKSKIWEFSEHESMIMPALRISYHHLPSHLKQCFVYCSLFPQHHKFDKDELILLWMAEGFLQPMGKKTLEEIGCIYFNELVARSFFQPYKTKTGDRYFEMHDLMHDLATFYAREFYFRGEELGSASEIGCKTHHLSFNVRDGYPISKLLTCAKRMRTIVCMSMDMDASGMTLILQLKFLRVLSFQSFRLDSMPESIGELIHLRYLDLSRTSIVTLPKSLSKLYNLQTLKLRHCEKLKMLPSGMQDLVNLRHLDIRETCLEEMPKAMSKLKQLQFLSNYIVGKHEENKFQELGALVNLHGSLDISNLENVINSDEASEAGMSDRKYINDLALRWTSKSNIADSPMRDLLDKLKPHPNLNKLFIDGYKGEIFPDWLGQSSYKNMTNLILKGCKNCRELPSLGKFPSLKHLGISCFDKMHSIGGEFYKSDGESCSATPFRSLETLKFHRLDRWHEWLSLDDAFPQLKQLTIKGCPELIRDLPNHLPSLEELTIDSECKKLACSLPRAPAMLHLTIKSKNELRMQELPVSLLSLSIQGNQLVGSVFKAMARAQPTCLRRLYISDCDSAISFPEDSLPSQLQHLTILRCKKLKFPRQRQLHESLQELSICNSCDSLTSFPLNAFPNLRKLNIEGCENMGSLLVGVVALRLERLEISSCPEMDSFCEGGLLPALGVLCIRGCDKLVSCLASMDLHSHVFTHLSISTESETVKAFPKEGCLPTSLESLSLHDSPSLETLDCNGLLHLTSLQSLGIDSCIKLKNMEGKRLPDSLTRLIISRCPLMHEHFQVKESEIWPKISHVSSIIVDKIRISRL